MAKRTKQATEGGTAVAPTPTQTVAETIPNVPVSDKVVPPCPPAQQTADDMLASMGMQAAPKPVKKGDTPEITTPDGIKGAIVKYVEEDTKEKAAKANKDLAGGQIRPVLEAERLKLCRADKVFYMSVCAGGLTFTYFAIDVGKLDPAKERTLPWFKKNLQEIFGMDGWNKYFNVENVLTLKSDVSNSPARLAQLQRMLAGTAMPEDGGCNFATFFDYVPMIVLRKTADGKAACLASDYSLDPIVEQKVKKAKNEGLLTIGNGTLKVRQEETARSKK
jgi:hypothetical protein